MGDLPAWLKNTIGIITLAFAIFFFYEARYASKIEVENVKAVILKKDLQAQWRESSMWLDINAKARGYWAKKKTKGEVLSEADLDRLEYLERTIPEQQHRATKIQEDLEDLEKKVDFE